MATGAFPGGTGRKLTRATVIVAGVAVIAASLLSVISIWLQLKNYRKPLLQRYVVRILLIVPIFGAASWTSLWSLKASSWIDPIRDVYEAFTIYTFFQLLINFLGGERALIIMMHGRPPVRHLWPLNYCLAKVDISDPHTFLAIKRGILQYTWVKPLLGIATIVMKATNTYQEGYVGLRSGYFWSGIVYNISITLSLYALALFWVCMSDDLHPFRPMPKFLCIKLIIFASYWQGFFLSILVWLGAIPDDVKGYTPDNISAAIQNALICFEMPAFAISHWYAFSWHDYADVTISAARMPVWYAFRDAFGVRDLIEDTKETFGGKKYEYRLFDSYDDVLTHEESDSRMARMMEGMRYDRGGKRKYWIPKPRDANTKTPLLDKLRLHLPGATSTSSAMPPLVARAYSGTSIQEPEFAQLDEEDERLYSNARVMEFGDYNYPVITAHEASREAWKRLEPGILTTSTNRHLLQPTEEMSRKRQKEIEETVRKGKRRTSPDDKEHQHSHKSHVPLLGSLLRPRSSSSDSGKTDRSQLVDLMVEDTQAEETERVRARKEGSSKWNEDVPKHFIRTYPGPDEGEDIRKGFEPADIVPSESDQEDNNAPGSEGSSSDDGPSRRRDGSAATNSKDKAPEQKAQDRFSYGEIDEERSAWGSPDGRD